MNIHHQTARALVGHYGLIPVEDLNVKGLARSMLAKSVHDAGWSQFLSMLSAKAAEAGRTPAPVTQRYSAVYELLGK